MDADRAALAAALRRDPYQYAIRNANLGGTIADLARGAGASVLGLPGDVLSMLGADPENRLGVQDITSEALSRSLFGMDDDAEGEAALLLGSMFGPPVGKAKTTKDWLAKVLKRAKKEKGGTVPLSGAPRPKLGYAVATTDRGTQTTFDPATATPADLQRFIREQQMGARDNLGLWINPSDGKLYLDKVETFPSRLRGMNEGNANKQLAIYDLRRKDEIETEFGRKMKAADAPSIPPSPSPAETKAAEIVGGLLGGVRKPRKTVLGGTTINPGIYDDPRSIAADSAKKVTPESPLLKQIFDVDRYDLDEFALMNQDPSIANPLIHVPTRSPEYVNRVTTPGNASRLQNVMSEAMENPAFTGMAGWYVTEPLLRWAIQRYGPELGRRVWLQHHLFSSPMSAANAVPAEIAKGTFAHLLNAAGRLDEFTDTRLLPKGMGHVAHKTAHASGLRNLMNSGGERFWSLNSPSQKVPNYYFSKIGENWYWPTADAHFVRATGLPDVRPFMYDRKKGIYVPDERSIGGTEMFPIGTWFADDVTAPLGLTGNVGQPILWGAMSSRTGVRSDIGAPYLELLLNNAEQSAARQGITPLEALQNYFDIVAGVKKGDPYQAFLGKIAD